MSEKPISLVLEPKKAGVHYLESAIRAAMTLVEDGYHGVDLALGRGDTAWDPSGAILRGPDVITYVLNVETDEITAYPMEDVGF